MNKNQINEFLQETRYKALFIDGFDEAIVGLICDGLENPKVVYSKKVIYSKKKIYQKILKENTDFEQALEFYDKNILSALEYKESPVIME